MLYWLVELSDRIPILNVVRYLTFRTGGAVFTALLFVLLFGPTIINALRIRDGTGRIIQSDGPPSHVIDRKGTPTMGELMILSGLVL